MVECGVYNTSVSKIKKPFFYMWVYDRGEYAPRKTLRWELQVPTAHIIKFIKLHKLVVVGDVKISSDWPLSIEQELLLKKTKEELNAVIL